MPAHSDPYPSYYEFSEAKKRIEPRLCDITATGADTILHAVSIEAPFSNRLAKRILEVAGESAGPDIEREVRRHGPIGPGMVVVTHAGDLAPTRYLFHAVVSSADTRYAADPRLINKAVGRCVRLADLLGQTTMAIPPLGTGQGRASSVRVVKQMVNVILSLLPTCEHLQQIILATTSEKTFALFNNRVLADIALAQREQELKNTLRSIPPSLYGEVGSLLLLIEAARQAGEDAQGLLAQAEGFIEVASKLGERLPPQGEPAAALQLIIATGGSIVRNITQHMVK